MSSVSTGYKGTYEDVFYSTMYSNTASVGLAVVPSLKQHLLCKIHWVVLVLPLPSYSNWILSSLDDWVKLLLMAHTDKSQVVELRLEYIKVKLVV